MDREIPGVPGRAHDGIRPPAAIGELDRLRLAEHDHARRFEPLDGEGRLFGRRRRPGLGARPCPMTRVVEDVLDGDRDSMERSHRIGGPRLVPRRGGKPRLPLEDADEGMELPVQLPDSPEIEIDQLAGRGLARREGLRQGFAGPEGIAGSSFVHGSRFLLVGRVVGGDQLNPAAPLPS